MGEEFATGDNEPPVIDAPPAPYDLEAPEQEPRTEDSKLSPAQDDVSQFVGRSTIREDVLYLAEEDVMRNVVKYGFCYLCDTIDADGNPQPTTVLEHISNEFALDNIDFSITAFKKTFEAGKQYVVEFYQALAQYESQQRTIAEAQYKQALTTIDTNGMNMAAIDKKEKEILKGITNEMDSKIREFRKNYLEKKLCSHIDGDVRATALRLVSDKHQLSKIYSMENIEHSIESRLGTIIPEAINSLKNSILNYEIIVVSEQLKHAQGEQAQQLMTQLQNLYQTRKELAKFIGERVVNPKIK